MPDQGGALCYMLLENVVEKIMKSSTRLTLNLKQRSAKQTCIKLSITSNLL